MADKKVDISEIISLLKDLEIPGSSRIFSIINDLLTMSQTNIDSVINTKVDQVIRMLSSEFALLMTALDYKDLRNQKIAILSKLGDISDHTKTADWSTRGAYSYLFGKLDDIHESWEEAMSDAQSFYDSFNASILSESFFVKNRIGRFLGCITLLQIAFVGYHTSMQLVKKTHTHVPNDLKDYFNETLALKVGKLATTIKNEYQPLLAKKNGQGVLEGYVSGAYKPLFFSQYAYYVNNENTSWVIMAGSPYSNDSGYAVRLCCTSSDGNNPPSSLKFHSREDHHFALADSMPNFVISDLYLQRGDGDKIPADSASFDVYYRGDNETVAICLIQNNTKYPLTMSGALSDSVELYHEDEFKAGDLDSRAIWQIRTS